MSRDTDAWVLLATRIPKRIHHALRLHCVTTGETMMSYVATALEEKLARAGRRRRARAGD